ncbi:MAG: hypothetical protein H6Q05_3853 [Acidobacteria bacterium]|nr:hypothetical protein [Acidobacteriota bacterium]
MNLHRTDIAVFVVFFLLMPAMTPKWLGSLAVAAALLPYIIFR